MKCLAQGHNMALSVGFKPMIWILYRLSCDVLHALGLDWFKMCRNVHLLLEVRCLSSSHTGNCFNILFPDVL